MLAAPAMGALTAPVLLDPGNGASFEAIPAVRVEPGPRRRPVPVPGRRRPELQLAGARPGRRQLRHEEHPRDAEEDAPERALLVARPRDDQEGRRVAVVDAALVHQVVDGGPELADARSRLSRSRSRRRRCRLGWSPVPVRRQLHVLARQRPRAREHRREQRPAGPDLGDELRARLQPASVRHVLLERRPGRLRGQQGNAVAGLLVHVVLAVDHDACR